MRMLSYFAHFFCIPTYSMLLYLTAADSPLGRFDRSNIPAQALLELLVEGFAPESRLFFCTDDQEYRPMSEWPGLSFSEDAQLLQIQWYHGVRGITPAELKGSFAFCHLPPSMEEISMGGLKFTGTLDFTSLPVDMRIVQLWSMQFSGSVDLTNLPRFLVNFRICHCGFDGSIDLTRLPMTLEELQLLGNNFSGSVDLTKLNSSLLTLDIASNALSGSIQLRKLPASLHALNINDNQFDGSLDISNVPDIGRPRNIYVFGNNFSGTLDMRQAPESLMVHHVSFAPMDDSNKGLVVIHRPVS